MIRSKGLVVLALFSSCAAGASVPAFHARYVDDQAEARTLLEVGPVQLVNPQVRRDPEELLLASKAWQAP